MDICGLIMARSGSQRVPNKNIRKFADSSLLEIKIKQLSKLDGLSRVYVNSDCDEILSIADKAGAHVIKRDPYYATNSISINETLSRTIITSVTTLLALLSIFIFGGAILKGFSFAMILGVIVGTYSSIYIANPILVRLNVSQKTILKEDKD